MTRIRFDFPREGRPARPTIYADPVRVVRADTIADVIPALETVRKAVDDGLHAAGLVAYEAAPAFDRAMTTREPGPMPLVWFGLFEPPAGTPAAAARPDLADVDVPTGWTVETSPEEHADAVRRIHAAIAEGRTYQVNLTTVLRADFDGDPEALYHRLRRTQGSGYHAFLDLGRHVILSASPELFFRTRGRAITARPMKGTRPRGRWPAEDRALAEELHGSAKDRAENLMIVDLIRNDLGRVCAPGTVEVPALWEVERYRTVWQLTSTVTGRLRDDVGLVDLFRALFPCGSITGAPKISTMEIIAGLERSPRQVYCGAIGWVRPGEVTFSVPIRTAWLDRDAGRITYGAGGGVVWDSTPEAEYDEMLAKTAVVRDPWPPFRLLETMALIDGRAVRLDRHLDRMHRSASRFDFPFPEAEVRAAIRRAAQRGSDPRRLRVTLGPDGDVEVETAPLGDTGAPEPLPAAAPESRPTAPPPTAPGAPARSTTDAHPVRPVVIARSPVDAAHPFLYHKTTHRAVYDRHLDDAPARAFDVLLWNEDGHATEFCRGNVVAELDGRLLTPPRSAGLLPGCFRAELLDAGQIAEASLTLDDVRRATRLWFINSARQWVPVRLESD